MTKGRFLEQREESWKRFESLLVLSETRRVSKLKGEEVSEFSRLFRQTCNDLATVRSRDWGASLERYLNSLVTRGHNNFYRSSPGKPREILRFFAETFPRELRSQSRYFLVALVLFLAPAILAGGVVFSDPSTASFLLPDEMLQQAEKMYEKKHTGTGQEAGMAGFYARNNIGIAFRCYATGILLGIGTVFFLMSNGMFLGTFCAYVTSRGHGDNLLSFIISHGSFELTAIAIAGAGGLVLGHALVHPGRFRRLDALRIRGRVSLHLAGGAAGMLAVAALIEAFWSPSAVPSGVKIAVGIVLWILVILYLSLAGRTLETKP